MVSQTQKRYILRLIGRCIIFAICSILCFFAPQEFEVLEGTNFFSRPSLLHLLWLIWIADMIQQIIPIKNKLPLGSMKLFANRFQSIRDKINYGALRNYILTTTKAAYKVFLLWCWPFLHGLSGKCAL